ncbi:glycosyltransferase family 2 protein [bacterium]|nr:glycosyltransferase family 2 protein [bacterium]
MGLPALSVIVPTLNEEASLGGTLDALKVAGGKDFESVEIVVVDGGSRDRTVEIAKSRGTQVFECPPGRGRQMDLGAREAVGDILLFLHADSIPPRCYLPLILQALDRPDVVAGAFSLRIDSAGFAYRLIDGVTNWRARFLRSPYGDQGLFLKASVFKDLGGFRDLPILEDFDLVRRLRRRGRICILPEAVCASPRRWVKRGLLRTWLMNQTMLAGYYMGVSPVRLSQFYYGTK